MFDVALDIIRFVSIGVSFGLLFAVTNLTIEFIRHDRGDN